MSRAKTSMVAALTCLLGCQALGTSGVQHGGPRPVSAARATAAPHLGPPASPTPSAAPTAAGLAGAGLLKRPAGDVHALTGVVRLEANYVVGTGAGALISDHGSQVIRLADAGLISDAGGNLIANNSSNVVSNNGGGLISDNGGGLVSDHGGGIVSNHGGGLVAKSAYRVSATGADVPPFGTILPAAGVAVGAQDLTSGKLLQLGKDSAGNPAYAVITDKTGGFHVFLPGTLAGSVRVVSAPLAGQDDRLATALLSSQLGAQIALDEDTARVAESVRQILVANWFRGFGQTASDIQDDGTALQLVDPVMAQDYVSGRLQLLKVDLAQGVKDWSVARRLALAERLADIGIARCNLESIATPQSYPFGAFIHNLPSPSSGEPLALDATSQLLTRIRVNISAVMQRKAAAGEDPSAYFESKSYIQDAEARDHTSYKILQPADFNDFIVRGVAANPNLPGVESTLTLAQILADPDVGLSNAEISLFVRAQLGISSALTKAGYGEPNSAIPAFTAAIEQAGKQPLAGVQSPSP